MKSIRDTLHELIQNENIKTEIKMIFKPFAFMIYNELYFYLLMVLVYCGLLFLFILGSFLYLVSIHRELKRVVSQKMLI
jgi:hypothetical protein